MQSGPRGPKLGPVSGSSNKEPKPLLQPLLPTAQSLDKWACPPRAGSRGLRKLREESGGEEDAHWPFVPRVSHLSHRPQPYPFPRP